MSSSSSRESSPEQDQAVADAHAAARLAQLEKLLQSSLGYADVNAGDKQPPKKKRKKGKVGPIPVESAPVVAIEVDEEEVVPFRLFSTQKTPQAVVIREREGWDAVKDPRIRDATEESDAVYQQRLRDIASIAVDGRSLVSNAPLEPLTRHANRVTTRKLTSRAALPTLAYLNAVSPALDAPAPLSTSSNSVQQKKTGLQVPVNGAAPRRMQPVRRPLERLASVKLELVTLLKARAGSAGTVKKKRVSKARRAAAHRRAVAHAK